MNPDLHIETILDEFLKKIKSTSETEALLLSYGITDASDEMDLHIAAATALQRYNVLQQVKHIHGEFNNPPQSSIQHGAQQEQAAVIKMKPYKWVLSIAASVLLMGAWFTYQYSITSSSKLYSEIYQPYTVNTDRGMSEIKVHNMLDEFKRKDYHAVIKTYESLGAATNNREKFLAAYAYSETGNYKQSLLNLQQLLAYNKQTNSRLYNDEAEFYAGLAYLKLKDSKSATAIFTAILNNPNHTFHERVSNWIITRLKWID